MVKQYIFGILFDIMDKTARNYIPINMTTLFRGGSFLCFKSSKLLTVKQLQDRSDEIVPQYGYIVLLSRTEYILFLERFNVFGEFIEKCADTFFYSEFERLTH